QGGLGYRPADGVAARSLPRGERAPHGRVRFAPAAAADRAAPGAPGSPPDAHPTPPSRGGRVMRIGSEAHQQRFCRQFIDSHQQFDPETLPWPDLDEAALQRLRTVPFWQEVLHTERRAGAIVAAYGATIADPLVREAVELQGFE